METAKHKQESQADLTESAWLCGLKGPMLLLCRTQPEPLLENPAEISGWSLESDRKGALGSSFCCFLKMRMMSQ